MTFTSLSRQPIPSPPPIEGFDYDPVGNRTSATIEADFSLLKAHNYTYDWENKLVKVEYPYPGMANGFKAEYQYDALGRRIEKNVNGVITRYVYDGANIIAEYDGSGSLSAKYYHNLIMDDPMAMEQGGSTYYYHKDALGSITDITDASGNIVRSYTYKSFGEVYTPSGGLVQPYMYTGREYDPESGLYYYRARYYDPKEGRFLTKDPIGFQGGDVNLYRYVKNNPVNWMDPNGYFAFIPFLIGGGFGALSGVMGAIAQGGGAQDIAVSAGIGFLFGLGATSAATLAPISSVLLGALIGEISNIYGQLYTLSKTGDLCAKNIDLGSVIGSMIGSGTAAPLKAALTKELERQLSAELAGLVASWASFTQSVAQPLILSNIGKQIGRK